VGDRRKRTERSCAKGFRTLVTTTQVSLPLLPPARSLRIRSLRITRTTFEAVCWWPPVLSSSTLEWSRSDAWLISSDMSASTDAVSVEPVLWMV